MGFDIRLPIGVLLAAIGVLLVGYGVLGDPTQYSRTLGINMNLWWGLLMASVGGCFLLATRKG